MRLGFGSWRLFLALLVATSHLWADMLGGPAAYAVWGFFVLSGFLMTHVLNSKYGFAPAGLRNYAYNRFLRIFPGFWTACLLGALVLWWLQAQGVDARKLNPAFGMPRDWKEWGFLATLLPAFPRWNAPVPVANALSVEVGFYLLMPLLARHRSTAWFGLVFGMLIVADHGLMPDSFGPRYAWFLPAAPAFATGALVFHYRDALRRFAAPGLAVSAWIAHALLTLYEPLNAWPWTIGLYSGTLLSAWVVVSLSERGGSRLDDALGELSYPYYLLHCTAGALLLPWFGYDRGGTYALCGLLLTLIASMVMVRLVDRPLLRRKRPPLMGEVPPEVPGAREPRLPSAWPAMFVRVAPWIAVAAYLVLSTMWLSQPGPYYDEWIFVPVSLRTLGGCDLEAAVTHHLGCLPLTQAPAYVGAIKAWAMAPIFAVFGVDAWTVRLPPILLGLATLLLLARFLRGRLGERATACALLLMCIDAAFVWHTRVDWGPFAIATFCKIVALVALLRWLEAGRTRDLAWLLVALCLGLFDKLNFLWVTLALGAAALALEPRLLVQRLRTATLVPWLLLAGAFVLHVFAMWTLVLPAMRMTLPDVPTGVPLLERAAALRQLYDVAFGGFAVHDFVFAVDPMRPRWPAVVQLLLLAIAPFAWWKLRGEETPAARLFRWSTLLTIVLLLCLLATQQVGGSHHLVVLWPFPILQAASLAVLAWQRQALPRPVLAGAIAAAMLAFGVMQANAHATYARKLMVHGPYRAHFDPALADVAAFARESGARTVASAHWGLHVALLSLAGDAASHGYRDWWAIFVDPPEADPARTDWLKREFLDGGDLAVVEWTSPSQPAPWLDAYLAAWGACPRDAREFAGSDGQPLVRARLFYFAADGTCGGTSPSSTPRPDATSSAATR